MALLRYLLVRVRNPNLQAGLFYLGPHSELKIEPTAKVVIGYGVELMANFYGHFDGTIRIGNGVFFNRGGNIVALEALTIGDNTIFGEYVSIHDENHIPTGSGPIKQRGVKTKPIVIGSNVWVGTKATIVQGVNIGDNAVIGANAVVTNSVPANCLAVGVPARVVREIEREAWSS